MKRKGKVTLKFKDRKLRYEVMANRKKLMEKKNELKELHFEESLFLSYIICTGSHNLFYKCLQLKKPQKNLCLLIFQQCYVRLMDKCPIFKIFHESYLKELPRVNVDDLLSSSSY